MSQTHRLQMFREDGSMYLQDLQLANTWWSRFKGLQFRKSMPSETGLLLKPCPSVHTFWMRFPIHLIFLDSQYKVLECRENVAPWSVAIPQVRNVKMTLEVNVGKQLPVIGETLQIALPPQSSADGVS